MKNSNSSIYRLMRVLHRDIGFFVIGLTVIYCISGFMLTYRDTDFLKSETEVSKTIESGLAASQVVRALHLKGVRVLGEDEQEVRFTGGTYNKQTGAAEYVSMELPSVLQSFNNLHFVSSKDSRHWFTALYAALLLFLAVSSFWMYKPGSKYFKRGLFISIAGFVVSAGLLMV